MKRIITITLLTVISAGLFANGTSENNTRTIKTSQSKLEYNTIGEKQIEPNASIISAFNSGNYPVDAQYLKSDADLRTIPHDVIKNIDMALGLLIDTDLDENDSDDADTLDDNIDNADDLKDLITSQLKSNLVKGEIEYTYMIIGRNLYTSSFDY